MCQLKSAICLKDRVYVPDHDHHSRMLEELGITDDYLNASKTFVRVELSPPDGNVASSPDGWVLKVEQDVRPDWFQPEVDEQRIRGAVKEWHRKHVLTDGVHEVHEGIWYAYNSASVKACNSASVTAYDSASVEACGSASVEAYNSASVTACNRASVEAYDSARVEAYGSASVTAYNRATIILPVQFQSTKAIRLADSAICINQKTHTIRSAAKWTQEDA